jgi:hypothetical protein
MHEANLGRRKVVIDFLSSSNLPSTELLSREVRDPCNNPNPLPILGHLTKTGNAISPPCSIPSQRHCGDISNIVPHPTAPLFPHPLQMSGHRASQATTRPLAYTTFEQGGRAEGEEALFPPFLSGRKVVAAKTGLRRFGSRAQRELTKSGTR